MNRKLLNKSVAVALALVLGVSMVPVQSINAATKAETETTETETTEKVSEEPEYERIEIGSAQDFIDFAGNCYIDSWSKDKYVVLTDNIDLAGTEIVPVPVFCGTFDGAGYTISNFNYTGNGYVIGLFRYIESDGVVKDLNLKGNVASENEQECVGSIAGVNYGTIKNCTFTGTVSGRDTVGGLVGINESSGTISGCVAKGRVTGYYSTGGIVGINHGVLNYCTNRAGINDDEAWVAEDDEMGGVEMVKELISEDDSEIYSGIDAGGIAGYSDGYVTRCTNSGTVGYEHTGYNIGGIIGRQAGVVSLCTNNGIVYGRKDVGGIVGQMEPYIEVNEAESLRDAIDKLHDLTDKAIDDMSAAKNVIKKDVDAMQQYADSAIDTGDELVTQISDFADSNIDETNTLTSRMEQVMEMLPDVLNNASNAGTAVSGLNDALKQLSDDIDVMGKLDDSTYDETEYNRVSLLTTVGGTMTSDVSNPENGDLVTVTVSPSEGYRLKTGTIPVVTDANGKNITVSSTSKDKKYTFIMPEENVKVSAEFEYEGTFLVESNVGGTITTRVDGDSYTFKVTSAAGYSAPSSITVGSDTLPLNGDNEVTVSKSQYINGSSVRVYAEFTKKDAEVKNVNITTGTGGEATVSPTSAALGEEVTITIVARQNYKIKGIDINNNTVAYREGSRAGEYVFNMPDSDANVNVTFEYDLSGNPDTVVFAESNQGGTITATKALDGSDKYNVTITANDGYDLQDDAVTVRAYINTNPVIEDTNQGFTIYKSSLTKRDGDSDRNSYTYVFDTTQYNALAYGLYANFVKTSADSSGDGDYTVSTVSSTGGAVTAGVTNASAGDTVYVTPVSSSGYILTEITLSNGDKPTTVNNGKSYSFVMPAGDVTVRAQFKPIDVILTSNLSGNATYSGNSEGVVTLTVTPTSAYTLDGAPVVVDANGNALQLSKRQSGSYVYEFDTAKVTAYPCTAVITFKKQNNSQTIDTAKDEIDDEIDVLSKQSDGLQKSVEKIEDIVTNSDGSMRSWDDLSSTEKQDILNELLNMADYLGKMSSATASILSNLSTIYDILEPYASDASDAAKEDTDKASTEVQNAVNALKAANEGLQGIVNYINGQDSLEFSKLGEAFDTTKELFHDQLKGLSNSIKTLSDNASTYSDLINNDLKAVNDQLNVVFNLLADRINDAEELDLDDLYTDVSEEDIDSITTGRVEYCTNKGIIQGDINVGGIAGSMSIDDEDPEDSAAGSVEYKLGREFIAKCLITNSVNEGYITSKKDGAGGICGYMNHGIIINSEGYGSVESTEGDYVGGICGQSLTIIKNSYALCSVSGGQNVGGIAGYGETIKGCYAMVSVTAENGRAGAIAGQVASYETVESESDEEAKVEGNYYVNDEIYGIDNISYVGVAEPISYSELLAVENIPTDFWHLKVIYKIEDTYLGSQEIAYGTKLDSLAYPTIPEKDGCYGVWPDVSDKVMSGTLVIEGEYKDNVTVVKSTGIEADKSIALVEDKFTEDTVLIAKTVDMDAPVEAAEKEYVTYEVTVENGGIRENDTFAVRLLNPYDEATVYGFKNGSWTELESKTRGQYLQVTMNGANEYFCIVSNDKDYTLIICCVAAGAVVLILLIVIIKRSSARRKKRKQEKAKVQEEKKE